MSFGYSTGDFLQVIRMAYATYTHCRRAPREFCSASQAAKSLYIVLKALQDELDDPRSVLPQDERLKDLDVITMSCKSVLAELDKVVVKYSSLGTSDPRLWHRFRFPSTEIGELTRKLAYYSSALSFLLETIGLGAFGRLEKALDTAERRRVQVQEQGQVQMEQKLNDVGTNMNRKLDEATCERREILKAVHDLGSLYRAGARENSMLSAHTNDSKCSIKLCLIEYSANYTKTLKFGRYSAGN